MLLARHVAPSVVGCVWMLTGGGDCPGLNAVIRAIVRKGEMRYGDEIIGFLDAWDGVLERPTMPLDVRSLRGMLPRAAPCSAPGAESVRLPGRPDAGDGDIFEEHGLDGLIVIGGNGTLTVACRLHDLVELPIVGVPKTIDNDIVGTDVTFGFHTAVQIATDAIDRLHTTAESPRPGDGGRGDGPPRRLDRHLRRHRRRRDRRSSSRRSRSTSTRSASVLSSATNGAATPRSSSSPRAPSPPRARWIRAAQSTSSATSPGRHRT